MEIEENNEEFDETEDEKWEDFQDKLLIWLLAIVWLGPQLLAILFWICAFIGAGLMQR